MKEVVISSGTIFVPQVDGKAIPDRLNIVWCLVSEDDTFHAHCLMQDKNGNNYIVSGGTGKPENIHETVGQLSPEEYIAAYKLGLQRKMEQGYLTPQQVDELVEMVRTGLSAETRTLTLNI